eukprot:scaffold12445_cov115-Cylindrotheca_fusiformis.AAC.4
MLQTTLIALLNLAIRFLESVFQAKELPNHNDFSHGQADVQGREKTAYDFMELEPPVTMEELRKQYKRLSLRYHPDRNGGTQQAHDLQQKLNASFDLIQQVLEGKQQPAEGGAQGTAPFYEEENTNAEEETWEREMHQQQKDSKNTKDQTKRWSNKKKKSGSRRKRDIREELKREMNEEQKRWKKMQKHVEKEQDKIWSETSHLSDPEDMLDLSREFIDRVNAKDINGDSPRMEKPKNYVIEACTDPTAVAVRLGMTELALQLLSQQFDAHVQKRLEVLIRQAYREGRNVAIDSETLGLKEIRIRIMTRSLDEDNNTLMHYAVYWEQPSVVRSLVQLAQTDLTLDRLMLARNAHGHSPTDFASIATDPSILPLMQSYEAVVKLHREQTNIGPAAVKAGKDFLAILKNADRATTLLSASGYFIGAWGFRLHALFCILGVLIAQSKSRETLPGVPDNPYFFEIYMTNYYTVCSVLVRWVYPLAIGHWMLLLIMLIPLCIFLGPLVVLASPMFFFDITQVCLQNLVQFFDSTVLSRQFGSFSLSLAMRRAFFLTVVFIIAFAANKL